MGGVLQLFIVCMPLKNHSNLTIFVLDCG